MHKKEMSDQTIGMDRAEKAGVKEVSEGFKSLGQEAKKAAGGGKLILFTEEGRDGEDAAAALAVEGFIVMKREVDGRVLSNYAMLNEKDYPECVSAIVGVGGAAAMECAKAFRKSRALACILFPTELSALNALSDDAWFFTTSGIASFPAPVRTILLDRNKIMTSPCITGGVGLFFSRFVGVLDGAYEKLALKGASPAAALSALRLSAAALSDINEENAGEKLYKAITELEFAVKENAFSVNTSCAALASLLAKGDGGDYPEKAFLAAYSLLRLYAFYLKEIPLECAIPPDRADNIEKLTSLYGLGKTFLLSRRDQKFAQGAENRNYLTAEYKDDFLNVIDDTALSLSESCRVYRRFMKKECRRSDQSAEKILSLVSLTGELVSGYPLIKHIKMTGILEPLLL